MVFNEHSRNLVLNTKDLVYVQSERQIMKEEKDRKKDVVVGLPRIIFRLPCRLLLGVLTSLKFVDLMVLAED